MKNALTYFKKTGIFLIAGAVLLFASGASATSYPVGSQQYYLAGAGVTSSQTTIQLTSMKTPDGRNVTMTMFGSIGYGTLEPQSSAKVELVTFTGISQNSNGSATLTGVTRGIDFVYPYAASSTLRQAHSGGSTFIISNSPNWYYDQFAMPTNSNVTTWPSASTSPATKGYVDFVAFNGAAVVPATTLVPGVSQLATGAQAAASTDSNGSGYPLVLPSSLATSTYNSATAANRVPVTDGSGTIDGKFLPTTIPNAHTFTGAATFSSTASIATSSLTIGAFPAYQIGKNIKVITTTGTSTFSVPSGITKVAVEVQGAGGDGGSCSSGGSPTSGDVGGGGGGGGYAFKNVDVTGTSTIQVYVGASNGAWSTFGTNGSYLSATGGVTSGSEAEPGAGGAGSGGDINIAGAGGGGGAGFGGAGGSSHLGGGAVSRRGNNSGANGGVYGGGGGGAACISSNQTLSGGTGAQGVVVVHW